MGGEEKTSQLFDNCLFPKIFQTFQMAIRLPKLIIAFLAITAICLAGWIMDFSRTVVATPNTQGETTELQIYIANPDHLQPYIERYKEEKHKGVFSTLWHFGSAKFHGVLISLSEFDIPSLKAHTREYLKAMGWAFKYHTIYCILFGIIKLGVIALAGGAICRITALEFARDEKPGLTEALSFGRKNFLNFFAAPLLPVGIIILAGFFIFLLGVICNIPWLGELIVGASMPLALLAGALIAVVLIGTFAGFGLMFPAVAYDGSDFFDAMSRSWHYIFKKPWRMGFYTAVAMVYGSICYIFVRFFAFLLLLATHKSLHLGVWLDSSSKQGDKLTAIWPEPNFMNLLGAASLTELNWSESIAAFLVCLSLLVVVGLVVSFIISFYFSANTIIYAILRNRVDGTGLEDVYTGFDEPGAEPTVTESNSKNSNSQPETETQSQ